MPKQHPFTKMKNVQIICFVTLLYPLELISVQYKKTTGILHCKIQPTIILYTNTYTNIDKSTPDDNVKNYERCHEFFEWRKNFNISHFESYYDVFFSFLWNSPDKTSGCINEEIWDLFSLFYRFELYFIDRYVYFDFKSSKIDEGNNLWQIIVV